jgi:hypothetical protein
VGKVYLVGSSLYKDPDQVQDYDFAVADVPPGKFFLFYGELLRAMNKNVDLIDLSGKPNKLKDIVMRVMGATVIRKHCPKFLHLHTAMKHALTDIDFMNYNKFNPSIKSLLTELGYLADDRFNAYFGMMRQQYSDPANRRMADIFFDQLEMCHTLDFRGRLELDSPTITLADFLLEKMQIVEINEKDIKDTIERRGKAIMLFASAPSQHSTWKAKNLRGLLLVERPHPAAT